MREHMQESLPARRELRKAQRRLLSAITSEQDVEADVAAKLAEVRIASAELQESMHEQMVVNLRELAPEERRYVLSLMKLHDNKGRRGGVPQQFRQAGRPPER